jgi:hypothetical protein
LPACSHTSVRAKHGRSAPSSPARSCNAVCAPILTAAAALDFVVFTHTDRRAAAPLCPAPPAPHDTAGHNPKCGCRTSFPKLDYTTAQIGGLCACLSQGVATSKTCGHRRMQVRRVGHRLRASRASDTTKIDDSSQPSTVARLSHQSMSWPPGMPGSGYQVERWSREMSGITVSMAYRTGLKQRTAPSPQLSAKRY